MPVRASSLWTTLAGPVTGPLWVCEFTKEAERLKATRPVAGGGVGPCQARGRVERVTGARWEEQVATREVETPRGPLGATAGMLEGPIFLKAHPARPGVARFLPLPTPPCAHSPPALCFSEQGALLWQLPFSPSFSESSSNTNTPAA